MSAGRARVNYGRGQLAVSVRNERGEVDMSPDAPGMAFVLADAEENGDSTVPQRSGKAPAGEYGVQVCVPFAGCDHEGAYKDDPGPERRRFTLWAITKIAYKIRNTAMAYHV